MREIMKEYGEMIISVAGAIGLFGALGQIFFSESGLIAQLVSVWGNGGQ